MSTSRVFGYVLTSNASHDSEACIRFNENNIPVFRQLKENAHSSTLPAFQRPIFNDLLTKLEPGDSVVVTKLTHLGLTFSDLANSLEIIGDKKAGLISMDIDTVGLGIDKINVIVKVLRSFKIVPEPIKLMAPKPGRPACTSEAQQAEIYMRINSGESVSSLARTFGLSRSSVINIRKKFSFRS